MAKKRCKLCKNFVSEFIQVPAGVFCNMESAVTFACAATKKKRDKLVAKKQNEYNKESRRLKRNYRDNDLKIRKAAAKKACHAYIRERDKNKPCICCGRPLGLKFDAGHFLESGNNSKLRYNEDNIHGQSVYCNQHKGGDSDDYQGRLRIKIGDERVDYLLANKGGVVKRTVDDYKEIEVKFKEKLKLINEG